MSATDLLPHLQWPAMVVTLAASWFVTSKYKDHRWIGFVLYLLSNVLWVVWGLHTHATALVVLQFCLALLNVLGMKRTSKNAIAENNA